jgi:hypothetical protein
MLLKVSYKHFDGRECREKLQKLKTSYLSLTHHMLWAYKIWLCWFDMELPQRLYMTLQ